jgi:GNAT superfamily N-acetyltransferase
LKTTELLAGDPAEFEAAFAAIGWRKPATQYEAYLAEQAKGVRWARVARVEGRLAGYLTILWSSPYKAFRQAGVPEISDLNVLPEFRRRGVARRLMDEAEAQIATRSATAGLGVGLYPDYGPAQQMYVLRGYVPDGRGLAWRADTVRPMDTVVVDDDLVLYLTKPLR